MEGPQGAQPRAEPSDPLVGDSERIERLLDDIEGAAPPELWQQVEELVQRLTGLYGEGLARALTQLRRAGALDNAVHEELCRDDLVGSLLLLHGLHPEPCASRVARALDSVRPYLASHRGDVELLSVNDDVVRLRLLGSCDGCSSSSATLEQLLERAIFEAAPEVRRVEMEGGALGDNADGQAKSGNAPLVALHKTNAGALVQIGSKKKGRAHDDNTACELCAQPVGHSHAHVVDLEQRSLLCACKACSLLFERREAGRYRTVPRRVLVQPGLALTAARVTELGVPVQLAFVFFHSGLQQWSALYPSPAGPTETELATPDVEALARECALVAALEPDVEALLVYGRRGQAVLECFLAPIDDCYDLVGRVRRFWQGFDGGNEARREIEGFFEGLRKRARPLPHHSGGTP